PSARPLWDLVHPTAAIRDPRPVVRADPTLSWRPPVVGISAFIFSEVTFFGALIVAFIEYRTRSLGPSPHDLDVPRTLLFSLFLLRAAAPSIWAKNASRGTISVASSRGGWRASCWEPSFSSAR